MNQVRVLAMRVLKSSKGFFETFLFFESEKFVGKGILSG
jgi:hypothetical protein